ncbi:MAG TPA: hypothetical protein VHO24_12380 [Opitutaceae bacterium]|nr:hypothetical protein [Opitutaceae bacterium]
MTETTREGKPLASGQWRAWAFAWGLAESTFFFIVPDVFITRLALQDFRRSLVACVWAVGGALLGGAILWWVSDVEMGSRLLRAFTHIPGINRDLIASAGQAMHEQGSTSLFSGMLRGQPYKIFAVHAGVQEVPLAAFLAFSALARMSRFVLTAALASLCARALRGHSPRVLSHLHALVWLAFYLIYFLAMR